MQNVFGPRAICIGLYFKNAAITDHARRKIIPAITIEITGAVNRQVRLKRYNVGSSREAVDDLLRPGSVRCGRKFEDAASVVGSALRGHAVQITLRVKYQVRGR